MVVSVDTRQQIMPSKKQPPDFLTVTEAAKELGLTRGGIAAAIKHHRLAADKYGSQYLIERRALERYRQYLKTRKIGRPPARKATKKRSASRPKKRLPR